jgi:hypothetical protein
LFSLFFWVEFPIFSWVADGCWFFVQIWNIHFLNFRLICKFLFWLPKIISIEKFLLLMKIILCLLFGAAVHGESLFTAIWTCYNIFLSAYVTNFHTQ